MFTILVTEKGGIQQKLEFDEEIVSIGRVQGNQVILPMGNVSKRHAKLEFQNGRFVLTDLNSTNGTYINGRRITEPTLISSKDKIYIGDFILGLEGHDALKPLEAPPIPQPTQTSSPPPLAQPKPSGAPKQAATKPEAPSLPKPPERRTKKPELPRPSKAPKAKAGDAKTSPPKTLADSAIQTGETPSVADGTLHKIVNTLIEQVARQIKRVDKANVPLRLDSGTAGTVRIAIQELVDNSVARGKLPPAVDPDLLRGKAFRAINDLGPLNVWLDDLEVEAIRISRPSSCFLFKNETWQSAAAGFVAEDDLIEVIRCLGAGLETRSEGIPGISRYRLEEGYLVFAALPPAAASGPMLLIDKTMALNPEGAGTAVEIFEPKAQEIVRDAVDARARLGVVGGSMVARLSVLSEIVQMLPPEDFVVAVEDLPLLEIYGAGRVRLSARGFESHGSAEAMRQLLANAMDYDPNWLAISGTSPQTCANVLSAAAGRLGVIAELPLGAVGPLDRELIAALSTGGTVVSPESAGMMLEAAFDLFVIVERAANGSATIKKIISSAVSDRGQWSPRTLFDKR